MSSILLFFLAAVAAGAHAKKSGSGPIAIPPSQIFEGDDGSWSTFIIQVGSPAQTVRLLPGTSAFAGTAPWVVLSEGCWEANPGLSDCSSARGNTFTRNQSTSWSTQRLPNSGLLQLNTFEEGVLGLTGAAYYGFDTVTLGVSGQNLPTLQDQLVAGIATDNYFLGSLGLSPITTNISNINQPLPSTLGSLWNQSLVPGLSWAYAAGAAYKVPPDYGSLVFGGYDESRLASSGVLRDASFSGDTSRDLQLQLQTITYDTLGSTPLLSASIDVFIDSMVSQLWLPLPVCQSFESAFNLTWNSTQQLYLVDEDVHTTLLAQNPTFTFLLASHSGGNVSIELPYAAFDLNATAPMTDTPSYYFPLQRAQNTSQYTLGRVFLQEAYIIADYDRQSFTISQAVSTTTEQRLVPICAPGNGKACQTDALTGGAIAGIAVGASVLIASIALLLWFIWRRRARKQQQSKDIVPITGGDEKGTYAKVGSPAEAELEETEAAMYELDRANEFRPELSAEGGKPAHRTELSSEGRKYELGTQEPAVELEAPLE